MGVDRILPRAVPTTFGTPELIEKARVTGRHKLELILPPVDLQQNSLDAVDARPFREQYGLQPADIVLVTVSRLVDWMKAESLRRTIDAVRVVARECQVRLLIVGDGPMRPELEDLANKTNTEIGASVVVLTGALLDPRPAYAAANIVIGMGGSALRGMAFSKPVIIVGENGFSAPLTPNTAESFYHKGMYGVGDADPENADLIGHIRQLAQDPEKLRMLGRFSRNFVERSFSLEAAIARLEKFCRTAANEAPRLHVAATEGVRIATIRLADRLLPNRLISSLRIRIGHG
jgi:glycosyltransferase involved in cell wall biosynthesis